MKNRKFDINELRGAFQDKPKSDTSSEPSDWLSLSKDLEVDSHVVVRFIEDANEDNEWGAFVKSAKHSFQVGNTWYNVPCEKHTRGGLCDICDRSAAYYADGDDENGKKLYQKTSVISRVLIVESDNEELVGTVRNVSFTKFMFKAILEELAELEHEAWCMDSGTDLKISKSFVSGYNRYKSSFARRERALSDEERLTVEEGAIDLSTLVAGPMDQTKIEIALNDFEGSL